MGDSRRSPRDRSPQRRNASRDSRDSSHYNNSYGRDSREYDGPPRSSSLTRPSNGFGGGRDGPRENTNRDLTRDFQGRDPIREAPRGPKGYFEPRESRDIPRDAPRDIPRDIPSGPRASSFSDGFRGSRGRGRGRGGWDEDRSRDRNRDYPREYDRRDIPRPPFREERGREWSDRGDRRDSIRGGVRRGDIRFRRSRSPEHSRRPSISSPPPNVPAFGSVAVVSDNRPRAPISESNRPPEDAPRAPAASSTPLIPPRAPASITTIPQVGADGIPKGPRRLVDAPSGPSTLKWFKPKSSQPVLDKYSSMRCLKLRTLLEKFEPEPAGMGGVHELIVDVQEKEESDSEDLEDDGDIDDNYFESERARFQEELTPTIVHGPTIWLNDEREDTRALSAMDLDVNPEEMATVEDVDDVIMPSVVEASQEVDVDRTADEQQRLSADRDAKGTGLLHDIVASARASAVPSPATPKLGRPPKAIVPEILPESEDEEELINPEVEELFQALQLDRSKIKTPELTASEVTSDDSDHDVWNDAWAMGSEVSDSQFKAARGHLTEQILRALRMYADDREEYKERYRNYIAFHYSDDAVAVKTREKWAADLAAKACPPTSVPATESRPELSRRAAGRFATEHDIQQVLIESEKEAKEALERSNRAAQAKAASEKEAVIPAMWTPAEQDAKLFQDRNGFVPEFEHTTVFQVLPPTIVFAQEEQEVFLKMMVEHPKQWPKISTALLELHPELSSDSDSEADKTRRLERHIKLCIQYYYLVKHKFGIKQLLLKQKRGRKRGRVPKPKSSNALIANLGPRDGEDDAQDNADGNGERRRPKRAAAPTFGFEFAPSDAESVSGAQTPGKRTPGVKGESGVEEKVVKKRNRQPKEKAPKQPKQNQMLNAMTPRPRSGSKVREEKRALNTPPLQPQQILQPNPNINQFNTQWDTPPRGVPYPSSMPISQATQPPPTAQPPQIQQPVPDFSSMPPTVFASPYAPTPTPRRTEPTPPVTSVEQQDRRNNPQTSSYWSVPDQTDFPALLRHFGTDWQGIAKWMGSKTHIMVYQQLFHQWLIIKASVKNQKQLVTNLQAQVKNHYMRQVESGQKPEWAQITADADRKIREGVSTGEPPVPTIPIKKRFDGTPGPVQRPHAGSADGFEDQSTPGQLMAGQMMTMQHAPSPPVAPTSGSPLSLQPPPPASAASQMSRFPAIAQAGPIHNMSKSTVTNAPAPKQIQAQQAAPLQAQPPQSRPPRGPALGYFNTPSELQRPALQPNSPAPMAVPQADAQRSQRNPRTVAHEAHLERDSAMRVEQLQQAQQQQAQQQRQEQQSRSRVKKEPELQSFNQYEQFSSQTQQPNIVAPSRQEPLRTEPSRPEPASYRPEPQAFRFQQEDRYERNSEPSRSAQRQYPPQHVQQARTPLSDGAVVNPPPQTHQGPAGPPSGARPPIIHSPMHQEPPRAPPPSQVPAVAAPVHQVQQEAVPKKSSLFSLLNDEPSESRPSQAKPPAPPVQPTPSPRPQQMQQQQTMYQPSSGRMGASAPANPYSTQHQHQSRYPPPSQSQQISQPTAAAPVQHQPSPVHAYGQMQPQSMQHHNQSAAPMRGYGPSTYDASNYSQPPLRRESSLGDVQSANSHHPRNSSLSGAMIRDSPYTASAHPVSRQQAGSPIHTSVLPDRDYHRSQYVPQQQAQASQTPAPQSSTHSPQVFYNTPHAVHPGYGVPAPPQAGHHQLTTQEQQRQAQAEQARRQQALQQHDYEDRNGRMNEQPRMSETSRRNFEDQRRMDRPLVEDRSGGAGRMPDPRMNDVRMPDPRMSDAGRMVDPRRIEDQLRSLDQQSQQRLERRIDPRVEEQRRMDGMGSVVFQDDRRMGNVSEHEIRDSRARQQRFAEEAYQRDLMERDQRHRRG